MCVALAACRGDADPSPEQTVTRFAQSVDAARRDPSQRPAVYELLSQRAQEALTERAQQASQVSGWELAPWEMLAPGRMRLRIDIEPAGMTSRVTGTHAVVTARGSGGVADVPLVREGGRWRIDLDLPPIAEIRPGDRDGRPAPR